MSLAPAVSVIAPLPEDPAGALRTLAALAELPESPEHEVVVVAGPDPALDPILARLQGDVCVTRSAARAGLAAVVNLGAASARGETLAVLRPGAVPGPDWLAPLVASLADARIGVATSVTEQQPDDHPLAAWAFALRTRDLVHGGGPAVPDELVLAALGLGLRHRAIPARAVPASVVRAPGGRDAAARGLPGADIELTIVIPTLDAAGPRAQACVRAIQAHTEAAHQIVLVDNGAPPQGFTAPVNAGVRAADTPYVVIMNDDVIPLSGWWPHLRAALDDGAAVSFPLTVDGAMREDFAGWCFALTADTVRRFGHGPGAFLNPELIVWFQDTDLLLRLRAAGRPPVLVREARIRHGLSETVGTRDRDLAAWIQARILADERRFRELHPSAQLAAAVLGA